MRKLIVHEFMSLDGVMQAPGGPDEDRDGGFTHGGWTLPYWHDDIGKTFFELLEGCDTFLLGRRTYVTHAEALRRTSAAVIDSASGNRLSTVDLGERSPAGLQKFLAAWPQRLVPDQGVKGAVWQCLRQGTTSCPSRKVEGNTLPVERLFQEGRWEQLAAMPPPAPDNASEWFWRGVAYGELGDCSEAIPALERGLKARTLVLPDVFVDQDSPAKMYAQAGLDKNQLAKL